MGKMAAVHLLPMYPYTSDDGFSVSDYYSINPDLGTWEDVKNLSQDYDMMYDAVVNHISKSSKWFQGYLNCEEKYKKYFIEADPDEDYKKVIRPRVLPLLTCFDTKEGKKHVWTTFSEDQIDLNFKSSELLVKVLDVLLYYAYNGSRFIRYNKQTKEKILVIVNVSEYEYEIKCDCNGRDIISGEEIRSGRIHLVPYQARWIKS